MTDKLSELSENSQIITGERKKIKYFNFFEKMY